MEKEKKISLEDAKRMQTEMLKSFHDFCIENDIKYFLAYGSLLGAIRHKGYIPWDDDVDIMIPYSEFEKLSKVYCSDRYPVISCNNNKEHSFPFARIYDAKTYKKIGKYEALGLFIDIYIIYGAPNTPSILSKYLKLMGRLNSINSLFPRIRRRLVRYKLWPKRTLDFELQNMFCKYVVKKNKKYVFEECEKSYIHNGKYLKVYPRYLFEKAVLAPFDNYNFQIPVGYDEFLRITYGDYMKLPPENMRFPYHGNDGCFVKEK